MKKWPFVVIGLAIVGAVGYKIHDSRKPKFPCGPMIRACKDAGFKFGPQKKLESIAKCLNPVLETGTLGSVTFNPNAIAKCKLRREKIEKNESE